MSGSHRYVPNHGASPWREELTRGKGHMEKESPPGGEVPGNGYSRASWRWGLWRGRSRETGLVVAVRTRAAGWVLTQKKLRGMRQVGWLTRSRRAQRCPKHAPPASSRHSCCVLPTARSHASCRCCPGGADHLPCIAVSASPLPASPGIFSEGLSPVGCVERGGFPRWQRLLKGRAWIRQ